MSDISSDSGSGGISRRDALKAGGGAAAVVMGGGVLAACGSKSSATNASSTADSASPATGRIKKGGIISLGVAGGGAADTIDPAKANVDADLARTYNLYDPLLQRDPDYKRALILAEEIEPGPGAKTFTIRLRDGVEFHNGKTLSADDLLYTWKRILDPKFANAAKAQLALVDMKRTRKLDKRTVRVQLKAANIGFPDNLVGSYTRVVPEGYDPKSPVGTGPFKFKSFKAGDRSTFVRNENYHLGEVHVDELHIIDIPDPSARVNALIGGQLNVIASLPAAQVQGVKANPKLRVLTGETGSWQPITMRTDQAPFNDVRVTEAFKLIIDRKQIIEQALNGYGAVANDTYARYDVPTDGKIPQREQDLEKAKSLLKAAGQSGLTVEFVTAPVYVGLVEAAQVFAQQAKGAGVNIKIRKVDAGTFFGPNYLKWRLAQDYWASNAFIAQSDVAVGPEAPFNETHFDDPKFYSLLSEIKRELDDTKRNEMILEAKRYIHDRSGYIIWGFSNSIDAYSAELVGLRPSKYGVPLGNYGFASVGFAA